MKSGFTSEFFSFQNHDGFEEVLKELEAFRLKDIPYRRVLSSMCTIPHPIGVKAHEMFINANLGDPAIFRGCKELEEIVIGLIGRLLHNEKAKGYVCSGGNEANIQALRSFRNLRGLKNPNVVVPKSAHFSFDKACEVLGVEIRKAELDDSFRVDLSSVESLIDENTIALVGIAGTTELGQIDPIDELSKIAVERDLGLHVDAAFGGFVIPFLDEKYPFDFELDGVSSITIDPHKMGMATIPAGGLLFRDEGYLRALEVGTPYLTSIAQFTLTGTRPGTGVASAYAVLRYLGFEGLRKIVRQCLNVTRFVIEEMEALGFEPVIKPVMNVVCFKTDKAGKIKEELYRRGWVISTITDPKALRLIIMPHVTEEVVSEFVSAIKGVLKNI